MNFCFGAVSKNVVDSVIQLSLEFPDKLFYLIPSRRQIDFNGGYSNSWTTKEFAEYVKSKNPRILIERDHGGPGQGEQMDDGYSSLAEDCKYFDIIHIDPWKMYSDLNEGAKHTIDMIRFCDQLAPNLRYEIATEESIRPFTLDELETFIQILTCELTSEQFKKIQFLVIQCGTRLLNGRNIGTYDETKLSAMLNLAHKYNMTAKEHNGDWTSIDVINNKYEQGLRYINISPEIAEIENSTILQQYPIGSCEYERIYELCIDSQKWKKWVPLDFDWRTRKDDIVRITCHYIYSTPEFAEIKTLIRNIDELLQHHIRLKLFELYQLYTKRTACIFCEETDFVAVLHTPKLSTMSLSLSAEPEYSHFMPYNILQCCNCNTFQNQYLAELSLVYGNNHIDVYGSIKSNKHIQFAEFITKNRDISGYIEVGGCTNALSDLILCKHSVGYTYTIIEPSFRGNKDKIIVIDDYFENVNIDQIPANTIIMSDVFEHFYRPLDILRKLESHSNIQYLYLNHPDFDYAVEQSIDMFLNLEHTFLVEHDFLFKQFNRFGFALKRSHNYENNSLFLEFERAISLPYYSTISNTKILDWTISHIQKCQLFVEKINRIVLDETKSFYVWPASIHSIQLFTYGLNYKRLTAVLDNSPNKIGKYLHTYNLKCVGFNQLLVTCESSNTVIFISNTGPYIKEIDLMNTKATIIYVNDLLND